MSKKRVVIACTIGNIIELYDFTLYGAFTPLIASTFFPTKNPITGFIAALSTYAVGFFMRPLGAILFGHIGDRFGRKKALTFSILLMGPPTLMMACTPSYESIGLLAPFLLLLSRLMQGLCVGAEYSGASIFLIEHGGAQRKAFLGSLAALSAPAGSLLAIFVGDIVLHLFPASWAWRLCFVAGGIASLIGYYIRQQLHESPIFRQEVLEKKQKLKIPLKNLLQGHKKNLFTCILLSGFSGALGSTFIVYMNIYLTKVVGAQTSHSLYYTSLAFLILILTCPLFGLAADRYGIQKIMKGGSLGILVLAPFIFMLYQVNTLLAIISAQIIFGIFTAAFIAPLNAFMNEAFPPPVRYSGTAISYSSGMAIFGGTFPLVATSLISYFHHPLIPAFYLTFLAFSVFIVLSKAPPLKHISSSHSLNTLQLNKKLRKIT